ncbi:TonB-dependent receptor domain-containing protein [Aurantiacibacter hainanensis]|uniref:TonB-dependent receptor domain-containing protein n=1 Tax=Aurantiacibacter hainanensis TaxID=3076114 RepID=UPI0030C710F0
MKLRTALKGACAPIAFSVALAANPVLAQDEGDETSEEIRAETPGEDEEPASATGTPPPAADTIFVTGSRIRRDEFSSASPITLVDPEIAVRQGLMDTGSMIQGSPIAAGSSQVTASLSSQFLVDGGQGVQTISLRGLGANRTLVLLNGRRAGPAGTRGAVSAFDLNVLPQSIVERVDILKDGASSIYGSDAVAGVVNLITKTDTDGIEFDIFGSVPTTSGGETWSAAATWGETFDRGHVMVSANYFRQNELARGDRDYLQCSEANVFTDLSYDTRADLIDPRTGEFSCNGAESNNTWGHIWTYDYSAYFTADGQSNIPGSDGTGPAQLLQYSYPGDNLGQYLPEIGRTGAFGEIDVPEGWYNVGYDPASRSVYNNYHPLMDQDTIIPTTDRYTLYVDAAYEITAGIEAYTELLYNKRKTEFDSSGQVYQFGFGETTDGLAGLFGFPANFTDPFANGFGGPALFSPTAFIDWYDTSQEVDYYRAVAGFRGDISPNWSYDLYGQYSLSDATYTNQRILADSMATQDFRSGSCVGTVTPVSGKNCVDVDWYSPRVMYGNFTAEELNFIGDTEVGETDYTQWYVEGVVSGELFELWGDGPIGIALGGQFRRDEIEDVPGPISQAGNVWLGGPAGVTAGKTDTLEGFGEINIPLLADLPAIQSLNLTAASRITNVKAVRSDGATDENNGNITYKLGADWEVTDWLRFRATYGTSFRAPALFEQFLFDQVGSLPQRSLDPCIQWGLKLDRNEISQSFADNCAADGVPANHSGAGINGSTITGGGLGVLDPEESTAWTASVVLTPEFGFLPNTRMSIAVDYFDIEVTGEIARFGAANVVSSCYASDDFPNDPLCGQFARIDDLDPSDPFWNAGDSNNIAFVRDSFININSQKNAGVDVTARMIHDFAGDISLTVQGQMTWQTKDEISVFDGFPESVNGELGEPKWVGDFYAQLDAGPWSLFYGLDVVGSASDVPDFTESELGIEEADQTQADQDTALCGNFTTYPDEICFDLDVPATFYHSASLTRDIGENFRITAGVSNIFDTQPPRTSNVGGDGINQLGDGVLYSQYDLFGRRVFLNVNIRY